MIMARKSTGGLRPPRVPAAQKSTKGKEKGQAVQKPKSKDNEKEVIVIGSSEDEGTSRKKLPPKLLMGVSSKKSLSVPASPVKTVSTNTLVAPLFIVILNFHLGRGEGEGAA